MSGRRGALRLAAVLRGAARDGSLEERLAGLGATIVLLDERSSDADLAPLLAERLVLWPSPSLRLTDELTAAIAAAAEDPAPRVVEAHPVLTVGEVELPLRREVVLATPGAVDVRATFPIPRPGVARAPLRARYEVTAPKSLEAHLEAINASSSLEAALRHRAGQRATYGDLVLRPTALALRALAGARGGRRRALPRAALEAYRKVLVAAKLWELAHVDGSRPVPA